MDDLVINPRVTIPADELKISFTRAGGPGGQHVNKVETAVELRWVPADSAALSDADRAYLLGKLGDSLTSDGSLVVASASTRSQSRNKGDAREKLAALVAAALVRPVPRKKTKPSRRAVQRRLTKKKQRSEKKRQRRVRRDDD